jgi:hypothetical protein
MEMEWNDQDEHFVTGLIELSESEFAEMDVSSFQGKEAAGVAGVACRRGNLAILNELRASSGLTFAEVRVSPTKVPLLTIAAMFDQPEIIAFLLQHKCSMYQTDSWGRTPESFMPPSMVIS